MKISCVLLFGLVASNLIHCITSVGIFHTASILFGRNKNSKENKLILELSNKDNEIKELLETIAVLREEISQLKSKMMKNKSATWQYSKDIDMLNQRNLEELDSIKEEFEEKQAMLEQKFEEELEVAKQKVKEESEAEKHEQKIKLQKKYKKEIEALKEELAELRDKNEKSEGSVEDLKRKLQEERKSFQNKSKEFQEQEKKSTQSIAELRAKLLDKQEVYVENTKSRESSTPVRPSTASRPKRKHTTSMHTSKLNRNK